MCINKNEELLHYYKKAKDSLNYNHETGEFKWARSVANSVKIGDKAGSIDKSGYIRIRLTINGVKKSLASHRISWFIVHGELPNVIDHINGTRDDNRISNLRSCTNQQNILNQGLQKSNNSGFRGVYFVKSSKKWAAQIKFKGKNFYLGQFKHSNEASKAYEEKAKELHGEFYRE